MVVTSENYTLRAMRERFRANGVFYTPPELAEMLRQYMPDDLTEIYDPTCGRGGLLQVYPDSVMKYGEDVDQDAINDCKEIWPDGQFVCTDVLDSPAFINKRFRGIVANPPFNVKHNMPTELEAQLDPRWQDMPCMPPKSKADWAFVCHCLHMLADDGVCALIESPALLYRGQREGKIRKWVVEQNLIDRIETIPAKTFTDTNIATVLIVFRKGRKLNDPIRIVDKEHGVDEDTTFDRLKSFGESQMSPNMIIKPPIEIPKYKLDPEYGKNINKELEDKVAQQLRGSLSWAKAVRNIEPDIVSSQAGSVKDFAYRLHKVIDDWMLENGD